MLSWFGNWKSCRLPWGCAKEEIMSSVRKLLWNFGQDNFPSQISGLFLVKQWLGEVRNNTNYHLLGAYYVAGPHRAEQFTHIISTHPPAPLTGWIILSLVLWTRKTRLGEVKELPWGHAAGHWLSWGWIQACVILSLQPVPFWQYLLNWGLRR